MPEQKIRHQFHLDRRLSEKLEALASKPGASKTSVLTEALKRWIENRGATEAEARFSARLDRQQRVADRVERKADALIELLGVFVQHQMALVAHQPPFDQETAQLGKERFGSLLDLVERRLTSDGVVSRLMGPLDPPSGQYSDTRAASRRDISEMS